MASAGFIPASILLIFENAPGFPPRRKARSSFRVPLALMLIAGKDVGLPQGKRSRMISLFSGPL